MSYVVTISREHAPISAAEFDAARGNIDGFVKDGNDVYWQATPKSDKHYFVLKDGNIIVTTPSDSALIRMQAVAKALGAKINGEEGEDLTDVPVQEGEASFIGCAIALLILAGVIGLAWWLLS